MAPTLIQVAQQAGVSLSTASRAFSNPDRIGADTLAPSTCLGTTVSTSMRLLPTSPTGSTVQQDNRC